MSDGDKSTTNNKMELQAVIEGLRFIKPKEECKIYSDSLYVINCAMGKWKRKANQDLWEEYEKVSLNKKVDFEWVKGHSGNEYNEKVDKMALFEARSIDI
jgi:ribonuclease HI